MYQLYVRKVGQSQWSPVCPLAAAPTSLSEAVSQAAYVTPGYEARVVDLNAPPLALYSQLAAADKLDYQQGVELYRQGYEPPTTLGSFGALGWLDASKMGWRDVVCQMTPTAIYALARELDS